jgi:hypothetical protein
MCSINGPQDDGIHGACIQEGAAQVGTVLRIVVNDHGGDEYEIDAPSTMTGWQFVKSLQDKRPTSAPGFVWASCGGKRIDSNATLAEQGLADVSTVTSVFHAATKSDVMAVCRKYESNADMSWEQLFILQFLQELYVNLLSTNIPLPDGLQSLTFGYEFNQNMEKVPLPSGLQSLTFGYEFNQNMEKVALPSGLQSLTFGGLFNQNMEKVALPSGLQSLTFGKMFNQSLDKVALPSGLQSLTVCGVDSVLPSSWL